MSGPEWVRGEMRDGLVIVSLEQLERLERERAEARAEVAALREGRGALVHYSRLEKAERELAEAREERDLLANQSIRDGENLAEVAALRAEITGLRTTRDQAMEMLEGETNARLGAERDLATARALLAEVVAVDAEWRAPPFKRRWDHLIEERETKVMEQARAFLDPRRAAVPLGCYGCVPRYPNGIPEHALDCPARRAEVAVVEYTPDQWCAEHRRPCGVIGHPARDEARVNQCDGCRAGIPLTLLPGGEYHRMGSMAPGAYPDFMRCQRDRYSGQKTGPIADGAAPALGLNKNSQGGSET